MKLLFEKMAEYQFHKIQSNNLNPQFSYPLNGDINNGQVGV